MIKVLIGNIFNSDAKTLVNTVNCVGIMGKGIAKNFKELYPDMYKEYLYLCKNKEVHPGEPYYYHDILGASIINFPTKDHWRSPSRISYITNGLEWFIKNYQSLEITSIAFPPLGCGNGGLSWDLVGPIMYHYLKDLPIDISIYAPYGTPLEKLSFDFLESHFTSSEKDILGSKNISFNPNWMMILETIQRINSRKYVLPVGRTIVQKIAYILTLLGVDTEFCFVKRQYGPYCADVKYALSAFANANLITETQIGKSMIRIDVTKKYVNLNKIYSKKDLESVAKTVDLFSRIKNTAHAELFTTIIYAYMDLYKSSSIVTEKDILDYILAWKPRWKKESGKITQISEGIRDLTLLDWIHPSTEIELLTNYETD